MSQLSIVIPQSDNVAEFEDTLASVLRNRPEDCQVIVVCPGGYSDPYQLGEEVCFVEADARAKQPELINAGVSCAEGEIVHLLSCGVEVEEGWTDSAVQLFDDPKMGAVAPLILEPQAPEKIRAAGVTEGLAKTSKRVGVGRSVPSRKPFKAKIAGPTLAAAFYRRQAIADLGGVDGTMGEASAELDLALSLRAAGYVARVAPHCRVYGKVPAAGPAGAFQSGRESERLFWKHHGSLGSLSLHLIGVSVEFALNIPRRRALACLAGRLAGLVQAALDRRRGNCKATAGPHEKERRLRRRESINSQTTGPPKQLHVGKPAA